MMQHLQREVVFEVAGLANQGREELLKESNCRLAWADLFEESEEVVV